MSAAMNAFPSKLSVVSKLVGAQPGAMHTTFSGTTMSNNFGVDALAPDANVYETTTIDSLAEGTSGKPLYVKIDVEGVELEALQGGNDALHKTMFVMVEVSIFIPGMEAPALAAQLQSSADVLQLLDARLNFDLFRLDHEDKLTPLSQQGSWKDFVKTENQLCRKKGSAYCIVDVFGSKKGGGGFPQALFKAKAQAANDDAGGGGFSPKIVVDETTGERNIVFRIDITHPGQEEAVFYEIQIRATREDIEDIPKKVCVEVGIDWDSCGELVSELQQFLFNQ